MQGANNWSSICRLVGDIKCGFRSKSLESLFQKGDENATLSEQLKTARAAFEEQQQLAHTVSLHILKTKTPEKSSARYPCHAITQVDVIYRMKNENQTVYVALLSQAIEEKLRLEETVANEVKTKKKLYDDRKEAETKLKEVRENRLERIGENCPVFWG